MRARRAACSTPQDMVAVERVDAVVGGEELGMALAEELQRARAVRARQPGRVAAGRGRRRSRDLRPMGEGKHVRFTVESARRARARRSRSAPAGACRSPTASRPKRRSRSRSTSGTASASRAWCSARRRPPSRREPGARASRSVRDRVRRAVAGQERRGRSSCSSPSPECRAPAWSPRAAPLQSG